MEMYEYWNNRKWVKVIFHGASQSSLIVPNVIIEDEKGLHEVEVWRIRRCKNEQNNIKAMDGNERYKW